MDNQTEAPVPSYRVKCHSCSQEFEALDTAWCACLVAEPTLVCNNCDTCFCKAPHAWRRNFWSGAPELLWDRKMELLRRRRPTRPNPSPAEVIRPLVLFVDTNHTVQRAAARVAGTLGFGFVLAQDGNEGTELAKLYRPEIVVTEAFLPKLDGREMCRRLRSEPGLERTRMVVLTGLYTSTAHRHEALRDFKVDEYLNKPLKPEQLESVLVRLAV